MNKYVALTGGIGCGKSVVANIFSCMNVPVYNSDNRAKILMNTNQEIIRALKDLIGEDLYKDSQLQKDVMSKNIFENADLLQKVNSIVHPAVWNDYVLWSKKQNSPFTIMETALLYETDLYKNFDKSIAVVASDEIRIQRVMKRDNCSRESVVARIKNQTSVEKAVRNADFVIENNDTFVIPQVVEVYSQLNQK